ncbi:MAG TPA: GNAT family N-acetyltransferase [Solirubrobacterales bacterium]|nr:GNAT family N-acetyltransferase [Solirubrobacterales bacterium]
MGYSSPEPLRGKHGTEGFECGEASLDIWIGRYARQAEASGSARVFVTTDDGARVVGFYALSAASVSPKNATERLLRGQSEHQAVPAILIGRLAVDLDHQGNQVGRSLLQDALLRSATAADSIGARAVIVHAISEDAAHFYERFGFERSPTDPLHLILLLKDLRKLLAA